MVSYISLGSDAITYNILKKNKYDVRENFIFNNIITGNCTKLFYPNNFVYNLIKNYSIKNINNLIKTHNLNIINNEKLKNIYDNSKPLLNENFLCINNLLDTDKKIANLKKQLSNFMFYLNVYGGKIIFVRMEFSEFDIKHYIEFNDILFKINKFIDFEIKIIHFSKNIKNLNIIPNNIYLYYSNDYLNNKKPDIDFNHIKLNNILPYNKKLLIIQTSPKRTASTLLVNSLYGLIDELHNSRIYCEWEEWKSKFRNIIILKSHDLEIDNIINKYSNYYDVYIYSSIRKELNLTIDNKYRSNSKIFIIEYKNLLETENNNINNIINNILKPIKSILDKYNLSYNINNAITRIKNMNITQKNITNKSFDYIDHFYHIHGSHRNRN